MMDETEDLLDAVVPMHDPMTCGTCGPIIRRSAYKRGVARAVAEVARAKAEMGDAWGKT